MNLGNAFRELVRRSRTILGSSSASTGEVRKGAIPFLKDIHKGRRVFIIANGPSMKAEYFDLLHDEITFGFNNIYKVFASTPWRPTYLMVHDPVIGAEIAKDLGALSDGSMSILAGQDLRPHFAAVNGVTYYGIRAVPPGPPLFATDLSAGLGAGCTVVYAALQFAWYMGVREVYLLGVDLEYSIREKEYIREHGAHDIVKADFKGSYFDPSMDPGDKPRVMPNVECMRVAMETAGEFYQQREGHIYNAAPDSPFKLFPVKDIKEVLAAKV